MGKNTYENNSEIDKNTTTELDKSDKTDIITPSDNNNIITSFIVPASPNRIFYQHEYTANYSLEQYQICLRYKKPWKNIDMQEISEDVFQLLLTGKDVNGLPDGQATNLTIKLCGLSGNVSVVTFLAETDQNIDENEQDSYHRLEKLVKTFWRTLSEKIAMVENNARQFNPNKGNYGSANYHAAYASYDTHTRSNKLENFYYRHKLTCQILAPLIVVLLISIMISTYSAITVENSIVLKNYDVAAIDHSKKIIASTLDKPSTALYYEEKVIESDKYYRYIVMLDFSYVDKSLATVRKIYYVGLQLDAKVTASSQDFQPFVEDPESIPALKSALNWGTKPD